LILDEYLNLASVPGKQFANQIGRSEAYVSKLRRFKFNPSLIEGLVVCHLTDWHVMPADLLDPERLGVELQCRGINPDDMPRLMAVG
jgi:hypothetical protein